MFAAKLRTGETIRIQTQDGKSLSIEVEKVWIDTCELKFLALGISSVHSVREGDEIRLVTDDEYEMTIYVRDTKHTTIELGFNGPHWFKIVRPDVEATEGHSKELGSEASPESYIRRMIDGVNDFQQGDEE